MKAAEILIAAIKNRQYSPSRIATYVDQFPIPIAHLLRPLLQHPDATVRYWGVMLLARHAPAPDLERDLAALTEDQAPLVRRAAVASLTRMNVAEGVEGRPGHARRSGVVRPRARGARVGRRRGSRSWRRSSRRCWPTANGGCGRPQRTRCSAWVPKCGRRSCHISITRTPFARNGAAEVLQNIGILDSLIVLEAATTRPSPAKIEMLRKITSAGGTRMAEALLDRVDPDSRARVRDLLSTLGLELAGVA